MRHYKKHHRHAERLFVFFLPSALPPQDLGTAATLEGFILLGVKITMQIFSNDTKGLDLVLAESAKGVSVPLSKGPFTVSVTDPGNTVNVTPGSADQTTPTKFTPNGTGATGTVTVTVTDTSQTPPLVGTGSFDVVAPVTVPDTLTVSFTPAP